MPDVEPAIEPSVALKGENDSAGIFITEQPKLQKKRSSLMALQSRLPTIRSGVKPMPRRYVKQVMCEHFRTQERLWRSSKRAGRECCLTLDAIERANETIN